MKRWVIPGGRIPLSFGSGDFLAILNRGEKETISFTIYHEDREPTGPYQVTIEGKRTCRINLANLIEPEALILDEPYAVVMETSSQVIVQFGE